MEWTDMNHVPGHGRGCTRRSGRARAAPACRSSSYDPPLPRLHHSFDAQVMTDIFMKADVDGSGALSIQEFRKCCMDADIGLTRKEINYLMHQCDADGDVRMTTHTHMHMRMHTHAHACSRMHVHSHSCTHIYTCMLTITHTSSGARTIMLLYMHSCMYSHTHACVRTLARIHVVRTLTHSFTHDQAQARTLRSHTHAHARLLACTHSHMDTHTHLGSCTHSCSCTFSNICSQSHTLTHVHTHSYAHKLVLL